MRARNVCTPSASAADVHGVVHATQAPVSIWHWYVSPAAAPLRPNDGVGLLSGSVGLVAIVTVLVGAVVSTVKLRVAGAVPLPAASTMRTSNTYAASPRPA